MAVVLLLLYFGAAAAVWPALPDRIPVHFGAAGAPDRWTDTSMTSWFLLPVVAAGLTLLVRGVGRLAAAHPALWNVPHKDRFLRMSPEERAPVVETVDAFLAVVTILVIVLFGEIQVETYLTALGRGGGLTGWFWAAFALVMVGSLGGALWVNARIGRLITAADPDASAGRTA
jgi:uncharacterized membrane protein